MWQLVVYCVCSALEHAIVSAKWMETISSHVWQKFCCKIPSCCTYLSYKSLLTACCLLRRLACWT